MNLRYQYADRYEGQSESTVSMLIGMKDLQSESTGQYADSMQ